MAAAGARSRNSSTSDEPLRECTTINAPPPAPLECGCVTPKHSAAAAGGVHRRPAVRERIRADGGAPRLVRRHGPELGLHVRRSARASRGDRAVAVSQAPGGARHADGATRPTRASASTAFSATLVWAHRAARSLSARHG